MRPVLLFPAHEATVSGSDVLLTWTSAGVLEEHEWYALTVLADGGKGEQTFLSKSTGYRLGPDVKPAGRTAEIRWQIYVVSSTGEEVGESLTPASEVRRFSWR